MIIDLILLIPLLSSILIGILTFIDINRKSLISWIVSSSSAFIAFVLAVSFLPGKIDDATVEKSSLGKWLAFGDITISFEYYLDVWSVSIVLLSTLLTSLILLFSKDYMEEGKHIPRYYSLISLFLFGMILLLISNSLVLVLLGWEIIGLSSWGLIGYYYYKPEHGEKAAKSGQKALVTTSLADIGFLVAIFYLLTASHSLDIDELLYSPDNAAIVGFGLLLAAAGKSAQFPLHIWISSTDKNDLDAMQGPTTVSALIHAATLVNAGIYLMSRAVFFINDEVFYTAILLLGSFTALYGAISALGTDDVKRVLAYSTISQLGYMFAILGIGLNGEFASLWHLINHAMFKGLLFLSAAALVHSVDSRDLLDLSGTLRNNKVLQISFGIGFLSLMGIPPFSGFFSKDLIIEELVNDGSNIFYGIILIIAAVFTAMYSGRTLAYLIKEKQEDSSEVHISRFNSFIILIISFITLISSLSYFILKDWADPIFHAPEQIAEFSLIGFYTLGLIGIGFFTGWNFEKTKSIVPDFIIIMVKEGFYIDTIMSSLANSITQSSSRIIVKIQTGQFYWNILLFTTSAGIITALLYISQFGGYF